ncbi:SUMF1/EgtB/PvdO family nonheme iron enzyme [Pseudomonas sp. AL 58]|uniref:formylglycine-generating enzyme family protein n=1 Tax=Pseudomonas sp. AL 58 TaxID=3104275 RepID=UPI002ECF1466|nr:SUMF1/EgtB/PvdO family nonheme iron enzyme [Pseudomonas sp. AL 58]
MFYLPAVRVLLPACALLLLTGCQAQSLPLPKSEKLSAEKVAQIATTINQTYPKLPTDIRTQLLNTVVQSLDNMVFVEGGEFQMGDFGWKCDYDQSNMCEWPCGVEPERLCPISFRNNDDFVHQVKLSSYYLSKFQVALRDFDLFFTIQGKPLFDAEYRQRENLKFRYQPNNPAFTKTWQEAKDYCSWLGELSDYPVDLPTEAQWEYAARSRGQYLFYPTDNGGLDYGRNFPVQGLGRTFAVDSFVPNPLGFYNMSGNATDWVNDWYGEDYYRHSPIENPQGPSTGTQKIRRGTNAGESPLLTASTVRRFPNDPVRTGYYPGTGFRCAIQFDQPL